LKFNGNELKGELQPGLFKHLSGLKSLGLENNKLSSLNVDAFQGLIQLTELRLYKNELLENESASLYANASEFNGLNVACKIRLVDEATSTPSVCTGNNGFFRFFN
jgi:Leucine-rich repeat (LRR) protein